MPWLSWQFGAPTPWFRRLKRLCHATWQGPSQTIVSCSKPTATEDFSRHEAYRQSGHSPQPACHNVSPAFRFNTDLCGNDAMEIQTLVKLIGAGLGVWEVPSHAKPWSHCEMLVILMSVLDSGWPLKQFTSDHDGPPGRCEVSSCPSEHTWVCPRMKYPRIDGFSIHNGYYCMVSKCKHLRTNPHVK